MKNIPVWLWIAGTAFLFAALGWWVGSWVTCTSSGASCEANLAMVEVVGTWFGGCATAAGLVFTGIQVRHTVAQTQARRRAELAELRVKARLVGLRVAPWKAAEGRLVMLTVTVTNKSTAYVTDVVVFIRGQQFDDMREQIHPGEHWTWKVPAAVLDEEISAVHGARASIDKDLAAAVKERVKPKIRIEYRIGNGLFRRDSHEVVALPD